MIIYFFSQLSITFRVDEMSYATYQPIIVQTSMEEYLPRPGTPIPESLVELFEVRVFLYSLAAIFLFWPFFLPMYRCCLLCRGRSRRCCCCSSSYWCRSSSYWCCSLLEKICLVL